MISLNVTIRADEVIAVLKSKRLKLRQALDTKMTEVIDDVKYMLLEGLPGKYLDPKTLQTGVTGLGSQTVIGFLESTDKGGGYHIVPVKANYLRFVAKSGDLVFTKHVFRPYLQTGKFVEQHLLELKPWIESQLTEAVNDALMS